jgi:hypothetical protein
MVGFQWMPEMQVRVNFVGVASADPVLGEVAGGLEFGDDLLRRAFGDADLVGDIPQPEIEVLGEEQQDVAVVGEEGPVLGFTHASRLEDVDFWCRRSAVAGQVRRIAAGPRDSAVAERRR